MKLVKSFLVSLAFIIPTCSTANLKANDEITNAAKATLFLGLSGIALKSTYVFGQFSAKLLWKGTKLLFAKFQGQTHIIIDGNDYDVEIGETVSTRSTCCICTELYNIYCWLHFISITDQSSRLCR